MSRITFKSDSDQWKDLTKREIWEAIKQKFSKRMAPDLLEYKEMLDDNVRPRMYLK